MKHYNIITAILFLVLAGLWLYLGLARQEYYFILSVVVENKPLFQEILSIL
jgi:hypothetical protein